MFVETIVPLLKRLANPQVRRGVTALLGMALGATALAFAAGDFAAPPVSTAKADGFVKVRVKTIQSQLDQVEGDYLIAMGDSHAERLYLPELCGVPVLNAGMSGATVGQVSDLAARLVPHRPAKQLLLIVGTNDIWARRHPDRPEALEAFRASLRQLVDRLDHWADKITLIAIPPVANWQEAEFPRSAAKRFDAAMRETCEAGRCHVLDIFDAAASPAGAAQPGIDPDGIHLANYARYVRAAEPRLCDGAAAASDAGGAAAKAPTR